MTIAPQRAGASVRCGNQLNTAQLMKLCLVKHELFFSLLVFACPHCPYSSSQTIAIPVCYL